MKELRGKVAAVTGAASGLGKAMALAFAAEGMHVALGDVEDMSSVRDEIAAQGVGALAMRVDVSRFEQVEAFAQRTVEALGDVELVCNNAGVALTGPVWENSELDWEWILGVNLRGVVNGVRAFVPRLIARNAGHVVNTASVAGLISPPGMGAYCVSKHAVVALSEALHHDLRERGAGVGVSVVCPAYVPTGIAESERNRPAALGRSVKTEKDAMLKKAVTAGKLSAGDVARQVVAAVKADRFYILTHPAIKGAIRARMDDILEERTPRDPLRL